MPQLVGLAIFILGRMLIVLGRIVVQRLIPFIKDVFKWLAQYGLEVGKDLLLEAIRAVLDHTGGTIEALKKEIHLRSSMLPRSGSPAPTTGRQPQYRQYYQQPIPYRPAIVRVLLLADSRYVPGHKEKVAPKAGKPEVLRTLTDKLLEELFSKQKQLAATILFELADFYLEWKSPLKSELWYKAKAPFLAKEQFRPGRNGLSYKTPPGPGYLSADITIVEDRLKAPTLNNLFAIVEVKFANDSFGKEQEENYVGSFPKVPLALIRVPEDCQGSSKQPQKGSSSGRRK
ncbi:hypothetical protein [Pseudogulbenkiania subflava]|uniref:Uncharacterized protein n=1 Tax=Pseudogulbenkiania subflava DSM 22618 TaxID=1123014 RepID=A0A1Y6BID3_9NEIS|nr:hypothetical protein [Pseudogulbenkiania subflava]SMF13104.1 hypothetical protein SAMN02745746_01459 [Pseudogulbenkiania subflava DSM 22618]